MKENLNREELSTAISDTRKSFDTDNPIVPFIEGDGIGIDIWPASQKVFDSAVKKAYNNQRKIEWMEVLAGQKAYDNENECSLYYHRKSQTTFYEEKKWRVYNAQENEDHLLLIRNGFPQKEDLYKDVYKEDYNFIID